jgi:hypothetical protein
MKMEEMVFSEKAINFFFKTQRHILSDLLLFDARKNG